MYVAAYKARYAIDDDGAAPRRRQVTVFAFRCISGPPQQAPGPAAPRPEPAPVQPRRSAVGERSWPFGRSGAVGPRRTGSRPKPSQSRVVRSLHTINSRLVCEAVNATDTVSCRTRKLQAATVYCTPYVEAHPVKSGAPSRPTAHRRRRTRHSTCPGVRRGCNRLH